MMDRLLLIQKYFLTVNGLSIAQINLVFFSQVDILWAVSMGRRRWFFLGSEGMKIGVLSDTHLYQVSQALIHIYDTHLSRVDMIIHAGDIVSPNIIDFLERKVFHGVQGNMDPLETKALLPDKKVIVVGRHRLGIVHGWGAGAGLEDRILPLFENVDAIIYGHSHIAANHVKEGILFLIPVRLPATVMSV